MYNASALCFGNLALWSLIKIIELYYQSKGKSFDSLEKLLYLLTLILFEYFYSMFNNHN